MPEVHTFVDESSETMALLRSLISKGSTPNDPIIIINPFMVIPIFGGHVCLELQFDNGEWKH